MDIKYFLGASILAGLFVFIALFALLIAGRSCLGSEIKERLDKRLLGILSTFSLKRIGAIKESGVLLTAGLVLIYPIGDATLHILDDFLEDKIITTSFECGQMDCKKDKDNPVRVEDTDVNRGDTSDESKDKQDANFVHRYHNLDEGTPHKLKFTRIGEIEAREDEVDRDTIDREKSHIQILQVSLSLFFVLGLAILICILRDGLRWLYSVYKTYKNQTAGRSDSGPPLDTPRAPLSTPALFPPKTQGRFSNLLFRKSHIKKIALLVASAVIILTFEEYKEAEDKYERLVFHIWKNHIVEKSNGKENHSAARRP